MTTDSIILLVVGVFFFLLIAETPVAWALGGAGALGLMLMRSPEMVTSNLGTIPYTATSSYSLAIIPMYILLGMFALHGRLAERLYALGSRALRRLPGGLGIATVGACAGFAAVTGSSIATAATIGKVSIREMRRFGYPASFAAGIVAVAGTLGVLIPPSIVIVIYGTLANESIAQLLVAGIIPGIVSAMLYMAWIAFRARALVVEPTTSLGGVLTELSNGPREDPRADDAGLRVSGAASNPRGGVDLLDRPPGSAPATASVDRVAEEVFASGVVPPDAVAVLASTEDVEIGSVSRWQGVRAVGWIVLIFGIVLGGIYSGYFTVIESGAMGALVGMVMLLVENWTDGLRGLGRKLTGSLLEAANVSSMAFAILVGASVLSTFLVLSRVPMRFTEWILGLDVPPLVVVIVLLLALLPMGMFLETLSILIIAVPLMHPVVLELGYDGVWFAILVVKMIEIGMVTPPVGMNVFVVSGASGIPVEQAFRGVLPLVLVEFGAIALFITFPEIITWLPSMVSE